MAPKTFICITLILSGVFIFNVPGACLTHSSGKNGISNENSTSRDSTVGQQIAAKQDLPGIPRDPRVFVRFKPRSMYADNVKISTAYAAEIA